MTPAVCFGTAVAALFARPRRGLRRDGRRHGAFVRLRGDQSRRRLAFFTTGARLIPAALTALLGTFEPILAPIWVWLIHAEVPSARTVAGGAVVVAALLVHIGLEFRRQSRPRRPGVAGIPTPH